MTASALVQDLPPAITTFSKCQSVNHDMMHQEGTDDEKFTDICVLKALSKAKFYIYLITSKVDKQNYVMKVFPYTMNKPHPYFYNEARFAFLNHPNVINIHHIQQVRETISKGMMKKISYIVMEYAPHGDFFDLVMKKNKYLDTMMVRTYFRQLIEGIDYLHKNHVSHLDLKLENLLIGKNFNLKIADFDLSYIVNDTKMLSKGTKYYRCPEIMQGECVNKQAADIYSAGIILFTLISKGLLPHAEVDKVAGVDFADLLYNQNSEFWNKHCQLQKKDASYFDEDFKNLFNGMVKVDPFERLSIEEIKQSKWYNGPIYSDDELRTHVGRMFSN